MVLEYFGLANIYLNNFFADHIGFISHTMAAIFLMFTEASVNYRVIGPLMDNIEDMFFSSFFLVPTIISTMFFILWAVASLFIYEVVFRWIFNRYHDYLTLIVIGCFIFIAWIFNMRYRD
jgi:hypothetical protein